jgi:iron complex transport system substrate-binding protein
MLQQNGQRVVGFDVAQSVADAKHQIAEMGDLTGHPDRARADIARIDAAIVRARAASARKPYRVLAVSRRGWVAGNGSLITALLEAAGLTNAAADLGLGQGGFASLEAIVSLRPDFILLSESSDFAEDQGRAFLFHPALERLYPSDKRLVVPERLTVCGGPMLADALDRLVSELQRVERASPR